MIYCFPENSASVAAATGANFAPNALIYVNEKLRRSDPDAFNFCLKHEVSHIYHNDVTLVTSLSALVALTSAFAVPYFKLYLPKRIAPFAIIVPWMVSAAVYILTMRVVEARADRFACKYATEAELRGGITFLCAQINIEKSLHKKNRLSALVKRVVNIPVDLTHPSSSSRLALCKAEAEKRLIDPYPVASFLKVHMGFWREMYGLSAV